MTSKNLHQEFGQRLYEIRHSKRLTQEAIAESLSVTPSTVCRWERGKSIPDALQLMAIADLVGRDLNEFRV